MNKDIYKMKNLVEISSIVAESSDFFMIKDKIILQNETGLHARPAGELVKLASTFKSDINLTVNERTVNAKSILAIMSLGIKASTEIEIECNGEDEVEAMNKIFEAFNNKFGE